MGFWSRIFGFEDTTPDPEVREETAAGSEESTTAVTTGPRVGDYTQFFDFGITNTALNIATVYRCVRLLSESVANLPLQFMRLKDGIFVPDVNSRLHYLLTVQPDSHISAFDFWCQVVTNVLCYGNAYIVPVYNRVTLEPDRLVLAKHGTVSHDVYNNRYTITDEETPLFGTFDESEVIHIKGFTIDGKQGISVLSYARLTLNIANVGDTETFNRFATGGTVRGIITNDKSAIGFGEYQDEELEKTAAKAETRFKNGEDIISLPGQVDFKQMALSSADMQFLESRKFTVRDLCRFFGVHPSFVFDDTSNNYKSAEMANVAFLSNTLNPILRKIEVELLRKLVAPSLTGKRLFQFDRRGLYACDLESRIKYQTQTIAAGIYTVNEWRQEENKPPVPGGDVVLVSANLRNITESGKQKGAQKPPKGEPATKQNDNG